MSLASNPGVRLITCVVAAPVLFLLTTPLVLAATTQLYRVCCRRKQRPTQSALYSGRVWHTRFLPTRHAFEYPLFLFCIDLQEVEEGIVNAAFGLLRFIVSFRESDHLKQGSTGDDNDEDDTTAESSSLLERVFALVDKKTNHAFQPNRDTHRVVLVTHLSYYGYCFNPVSFYYIMNRTSSDKPTFQAMVAEVSNTPWNEMYCYVLHPDSVDEVVTTTGDDNNSSCHYVFPKRFHVSPFMEMQYNYEWTFHPFSTSTTDSTIRVINNLRQAADKSTDAPSSNASSSLPIQFHARLILQKRCSVENPLRMAWYLTTFPMHCVAVQVWIHYEAFWLFLKGIPFQPHPQGSETTASRMIGTVMTPFFAVKEQWENKWNTKKDP